MQQSSSTWRKRFCARGVIRNKAAYTRPGIRRNARNPCPGNGWIIKAESWASWLLVTGFILVSNLWRGTRKERTTHALDFNLVYAKWLSIHVHICVFSLFPFGVNQVEVYSVCVVFSFLVLCRKFASSVNPVTRWMDVTYLEKLPPMKPLRIRCDTARYFAFARPLERERSEHAN